MTDGRKIVVAGAGGHAKVVIDFLRMSGWDVIGCTDPEARGDCSGAPVLGSDDALEEIRAQGVSHAFCALGDNRLRQRIGRQLQAWGFDVPSLVGPGAFVSSSASIGAGAAILGGALVNVDCTIGDFAIVNTNASVDHDGVIGSSAHIGPGASLAGKVTVGDMAFVATGSCVVPDVRIGRGTIVGAGSVVVRDLPDGVIAYGNPAVVKRKLKSD